MKMFDDSKFCYELSGIKKNDNQEVVIQEGLKFFKTSSRLYKLVDKLTKKNAVARNQQVQMTINKINKLAQEFEYVEDLYDIGKKAEAKLRYKSLKDKYSDLLKILNNSEVKSALKTVAGIGITIAAMFVPYMAMGKFFPNLDMVNINKMTPGKDKTFAYLKRSGMFTLLGLPTTFLRSGLNSLNDSQEREMVKKIDRMLDFQEEKQ